MFESITLCNFQCHKKLVVELDEHLTVLTGRSDIGKSSVVRACRWLCLNQPAGNEFVSHGEKFSRVILKVDKHKIIRRIGDRNEYKLDGKPYKAFGREVPTDIASLLNLNEDNFQSQLDPPFWFSLSAGQVSKELNRIINLGAIDEVMSYLLNEGRKAKQNVELTRNRLREAKSQKDNYAWVPAAASKLASLQKLADKLLVKRTQAAQIRELTASSAKLTSRLESSGTRKARGLVVQQVGEQLVEQQTKQKELKNLLGDIKNLEDDLCKAKEKLKKTQQELDLALSTSQTCPVCNQSMLSQS